MLWSSSHPASLQILRRSIRAYHSINPNHTYQQSLAEGFQGSTAEWQRVRVSQLNRAPYEKALIEGYQGSYKEWNLSENAHYVKLRTTGSCPYISTLQRAEIPPESHLLLFKRDNRSPVSFRAKRWVLKDGHSLGLAVIYIYAPEVKADEELWLYPYFNPVTKTLAFQRPDGTNHPYLKILPRLAAADQCRPLLYLAKIEGLLDDVPDGRLSSLSFGKVRESGFAVNPSINPQGAVGVRIPLKSKTSVKLGFFPAVGKDRRSILFFPYIGDAGILRLWDTEMDAPLAIRSFKGIQEGWDARTVRTRFPALFDFAQTLGYWKNVQ